MRTPAIMVAAVAAVALVAVVVLRLTAGPDAFPTSVASLPPRLSEGAGDVAPSGPAADLVLSEEGIGDVAFGTPADQTVAQLTDVLGRPDEGPYEFWCSPDADAPQVGEGYQWQDLSIVTVDDKFEGWSIGAWEGGRPELGLRTAEGVGVGDTVAMLQQRFGEQLHLYMQEFEGEPPYPSFRVGASEQADRRTLTGLLTGHDPDDTVNALGMGDPCP